MQEKGKEKTIYADQIEGRNSVLELLESGKDINKIFVTKGEKHGSIHKIIAKARERKIIIVEKAVSHCLFYLDFHLNIV